MRQFENVPMNVFNFKLIDFQINKLTNFQIILW